MGKPLPVEEPTVSQDRIPERLMRCYVEDWCDPGREPVESWRGPIRAGTKDWVLALAACRPSSSARRPRHVPRGAQHHRAVAGARPADVAPRDIDP